MSLESRLTAVERERDELKAQVDSLTESLRQARLAIAEAEQAQKLSRASSPAVMVSEPSDHDDQEWGCGEDEDEESWK
jgi:phage shock protein A